MYNLSTAVGAERRRYERFPFRRMVTLHFFEDTPMEFPAIDISAGRIGVRSHINIAADKMCIAKVSIVISQGNLSFEASAQVIHSIYSRSENGFILGLNYIKIEPSLQTAIVCLMRGLSDDMNSTHDVTARFRTASHAIKAPNG